MEDAPPSSSATSPEAMPSTTDALAAQMQRVLQEKINQETVRWRRLYLIRELEDVVSALRETTEESLPGENLSEESQRPYGRHLQPLEGQNPDEQRMRSAQELALHLEACALFLRAADPVEESRTGRGEEAGKPDEARRTEGKQDKDAGSGKGLRKPQCRERPRGIPAQRLQRKLRREINGQCEHPSARPRHIFSNKLDKGLHEKLRMIQATEDVTIGDFLSWTLRCGIARWEEAFGPVDVAPILQLPDEESGGVSNNGKDRA